MAPAPERAGSARRRSGPPGVLPLLQALLAGNRGFDVGSLGKQAVDRTFEAGLGPILAYVTRSADAIPQSYADDIEAADLTARVLSAEIFEALEDVLAATNAIGCRPVLLKGCSTAQRYYPEPHLRTMCDIDLLVSPAEFESVESLLHAMGFRQRSAKPAAWFDRHHHSMPFWHPRRGVWLEVHTGPFPPHYPLARDSRFSLDAIGPMLLPFDVGGTAARVMSHELQLVYTGSRWSEILNTQRGVFPILDAALLLRIQGGTLDWDRVCAMVDGSWAATALRLMLGYLDRWRLASVPAEVLRRLASSDQFTDRMLIGMLHQLVTTFVIRGRPPGSVITRRNLRIVWSTLMRPQRPWTKILALPVNLTFPPDREDRFDLLHAVQRLRGVVVRSADKDR
jgi:hypothetical protein